MVDGVAGGAGQEGLGGRGLDVECEGIERGMLGGRGVDIDGYESVDMCMLIM